MTQIQETGALRSLFGGIEPDALGKILPDPGGVTTLMVSSVADAAAVRAVAGSAVFDGALMRLQRAVRNAVTNAPGVELKSAGDAFLVAFANPHRAVRCAIEIQRALAEKRISAGSSALQVRIGLHTGTPVVDRNETSGRIALTGADVDRAGQIRELARGGQVLLSEETRTLAKNAVAHDWGLWELLGLGRHRIYEALGPEKKPERPGAPGPERSVTPFVGREDELVNVLEALRSRRWVTLTGHSGLGKSRLADEAGARAGQLFDRGAVFADAAGLPDSEVAILSELLHGSALTSEDFPDVRTALEKGVGKRRLLLVIDHLDAIPSAVPTIEHLLGACPALQFLATSREPSGSRSEHAIPIRAMGVPSQGSAGREQRRRKFDSHRLFRDVARRRMPGWEFTVDEAATMDEVLELTDGIPLSIEVVAVRVGYLSMETIKTTLREERMNYLQRRRAGVEQGPPANVRTCLSWSFGLLADGEQRLLARLAVFAGGWFAEDVAEIWGIDGAAGMLESLQARSILHSERIGTRTRYRMAPAVRDLAIAKLGDSLAEERRRHSLYFLDVLERVFLPLERGEGTTAIPRPVHDLDNPRAGMEFLIRAREPQTVARYALVLGDALRMEGRRAEAVARYGQGLDAAETAGDAASAAKLRARLGGAPRA